MKRSRFWMLLAAAVLAGLAIAWLDSRPGWDDTGISAGLIVAATVVCGWIAPRPWAFAIAVAGWIPLLDIARDRNFSSLLALAIGFVGAYIGAAGRAMFRR